MPLQDTTITHIDQSQSKVEPLPTLLPRSAWNSQLDYLRLIFRAKKALDRIEKEAGIFKSSN
ncbi:hypothetical protein [Nostoc sp. WHI]|uniref:hypothetical protein n=1 Tax=Nostoc sp. WHI TaxID=2650611 RepID=UPI001E412D24|nr:hypothetical protein [Nostoc sp. WHI]